MSFASDYGRADRLLHYVAFASPAIQKRLGTLENDLFASQFERIESTREVFVTGLPRSGTTLLLQFLYGTGEFTSFTYRHMPLILAPLLWQKMSRSFHQRAELRERAHGDQVHVSFDSPEAFEEVIWLTFLKNKIVRPYMLMPISPDDYSEDFEDTFHNLIRKLISLSGPNSNTRYLSKNNTNVSRLDAIRQLFPTSTILVPFREPLAHIGSLAKQHAQFLAQHRSDSFSRRYMQWLGHFEFGDEIKPINFNNWLDDKTLPLSVTPDFWLEYWTAAYAYVLEHRGPNVHLVDYDRLLSADPRDLETIADHVALRDKDAFLSRAKSIRRPTSQPLDESAVSPRLRAAAKDIWAALKETTGVRG